MKRSVAAALAGVLLIGLVEAVAFWPRGATPADEMKVRDDFAARDGNPAAPNAALRTPEPGIHRYATSGSEELKLGPLPTETRPYPTSISAPIVDADPGCFTITLHLLEQHSEDTTYCVGEDGSIRLDGHTKRQQIGPMNPTADMACDPDVLVDPERDRAGRLRADVGRRAEAADRRADRHQHLDAAGHRRARRWNPGGHHRGGPQLRGHRRPHRNLAGTCVARR